MASESESESEPIKHRLYGPSMSRRTRKPQVIEEASLNEGDHLHKNNNGNIGASSNALDQEGMLRKDGNGINFLALSSLDQDGVLQKDDNDIHRSASSSLDQDGVLQKDFDGIHHASPKGKNDKVSSSVNRDRAEGSLTLVEKREKNLGVAKMGRMVSRYVKVLTHLVKAKRDSKKSSVVPQLKR